MKKTTKVWLIIGTSLFLAGSILFTIVMSALKWDFRKLSTKEYQTKEYVIEENYQNISIITSTTDIKIVPSQNGKTTLICHEEIKLPHSVCVVENTLVIEEQEKRENLLDYINIGVESSNIIVSVPQAQYNDIAIKASTSDIIMENLHVNSLEITVSTGDINLSSIQCEKDIKTTVSTGETHIKDSTCKNFISSGSTGELTLRNVIATEKIQIERDTGDVEFEGCDGAEIYVKTSTGDVEGYFLTGKEFIVKTSTGDIEVPRESVGGKCEITTSTGDVEIEIRN